MGQDQREPADAGRGQLSQVEVLDDEDPMVDIEDLRNPEWPCRVFGRDRPVAPRVAPSQCDLPVGEPLRELAARSGLA